MLIYQRVYILQHPSFPWNPRKFHPDSLFTAIAATGYPGAKHPYSWWRSQPRWMLRVFTVPWRAVNRILALSMAFSTRKMGGSHWEILTFGVLKWFGSPSHWSILSHGHPWRLDDLGIPPWLRKPLGNGGNLDDWYLDLQFVDDCWLIRPMGNPLRLGHRLMASLSFFWCSWSKSKLAKRICLFLVKTGGTSSKHLWPRLLTLNSFCRFF